MCVCVCVQLGSEGSTHLAPYRPPPLELRASHGRAHVLWIHNSALGSLCPQSRAGGYLDLNCTDLYCQLIL